MKWGGVGATANGSGGWLGLLSTTMAFDSDICTSFVLEQGMELDAGWQEQGSKSCRNSKRILPWGQGRVNIAPLNPRDAMRHGGGDRPSNSLLPKKAARRLLPGAFFRRSGQIQSQHATFLMNARDEVPCRESPHEAHWSAARRDFPRRGCRMGGCPCYSRGGGMAQGKTGFKRKCYFGWFLISSMRYKLPTILK